MNQEIIDLIDDIVLNFRLGFEAQANDFLQQLPNLMAPLLTNLNNTECEQISKLLSVVVEAQARRDNVFVCDILKYEIAPRLQ